MNIEYIDDGVRKVKDDTIIIPCVEEFAVQGRFFTLNKQAMTRNFRNEDFLFRIDLEVKSWCDIDILDMFLICDHNLTEKQTTTKIQRSIQSRPEGERYQNSACKLVKLQSKAANDSKQRPLFVVHAIEGFVTALLPLAGKMTCPVYGLQCTVDAPLSSISDLAAFYVKKIKTVQPKGPYAIAGYSFGASVAFEMVLVLEKAGESATLVMFDGSPKYVSWYTETHKQRLETIGGSTAAQDVAYGLAYFGMVCANVNYVTTAKELESLPTFDSRLKRLTEIITEVSKYLPYLVSSCALSFYKKLLAAHNYKPESKVKSNVTLIKPTKNYATLSTDYGLSEVCTSKVEIVTVKGDHRTILTGDSVETVATVLQKLAA